jgi:N-acetylmuramoyl-L-alanine amidase
LIRRSHLYIFFLLAILGLSPAAEEKRLAVYTPQTSFSVSVIDHQGAEYVSVTDLLDPFGSATLTADGRRWKLRLQSDKKKTDAEFNEDSVEAKVRGKKLTLARPFFAENRRGFIPIASAATLLSQFVGGSANLRENSRRLFLGDVSTTYSTELQKGTPSRLVLHFSAPVNPTVATETGRIHLTFAREPILLTGSNPQTFDDAAVRSLTYAENNGAAELTISTAASALVTFSDGGKTVTVTATPPPVQAAKSPAANAPSVPNSATSQPNQPAQSSAPASNPFIVLIDAAHGGEDVGAALGGGLFEKDVTLAIARRLRADLDQRGIWGVMVRDGDATLSLDQRAVAANVSRAALYISIHVATLGSGVRVYTARFKSPVKLPDHGFLPWEIAQAKHVDKSHNIAASLVTEFGAHRISATPLEATLRPLRNVAKPAIAIEIATPDSTSDKVTAASYQQSIASAIGTAIAKTRPSLEGSR